MGYRLSIMAVDSAAILAKYALWTLMTYLTGVWNLSITHAAGIINIFGGTIFILKIGFAYLVDTFGDYPVLVFSSIAYSMGLVFLTMSTPPVLSKSSGNCSEYKPECIGHTQKVLLYTALALISTAISGLSVSYPSFYDNQNLSRRENVRIGNVVLDDGIDDEPPPVKGKEFLRLLLVPILGAFVVPHLQPRFLRFGIPAICSVVATILFLSGSRSYETQEPTGSPLVNIFRVIVASTSKSSQKLPSDPKDLYKGDNNPNMELRNTDRLRFLDKAAIKMPNQEENRWRLCTVSQVEETKFAIRMIPILMTFIFCGLVASFGATYFLDQENHLNRHAGKVKVSLPVLLLIQEYINFIVLSASANSFRQTSEITSAERTTRSAIEASMIMSTLCCITAAKVESRRLGVIRSHDLIDKPQETIPMSVFWELPLYFLLGASTAIFTLGARGFIHEHISTSMARYLEYFCEGAYGFGYIASNLLVCVLGKIEPNWFQHTSNQSRLDKFYWTLAVLGAVNFVSFSVMGYTYWPLKMQRMGEPENRESAEA